MAKLIGAREFIDCLSVEVLDPLNECLVYDT